MYRNKNIPKLAKITEDSFKKKPEIPDAFEELLQPKKELELEEASSFNGSDISDAFEELHRESFLSQKNNNGKNSITKSEADWLTMSLFTDDFKKTVIVIREELQVKDASDSLLRLHSKFYFSSKYIKVMSSK